MIPVYNCSDLLPQALQSVLMQSPGEDCMQIEVVDDASTDADVESIVKKLGGGRVHYFRQPQNVGSLKNFETCINRAKGQLVHILHGDDKVRTGYYQTIGSLFKAYPQIGAAFCRYTTIDEGGNTLLDHHIEMPQPGILQNWLMKIAQKQRLQFCTITVKRDVYESLGGFYGVSYGEDWEMWVRIAAHFPVAYTPEILAEYRMHNNSISSQSFATAQNIQDIRWVINAIQQLIPHDIREETRKTAFRHYAHYALIIANNLWHQTQNKKVTHLQIKEALKLHTDIGMLYSAAKIYTKMLINRV
ncbi:MAG TPA: glycosyltransferase [Flavisolibacter sp.]|nr:glycosyltransferase [Flavisolibacter sp.]